MVKILLDDKDTFITVDQQHRPVRAIIVDSCPCGKMRNWALYVTSSSTFSVPFGSQEIHVWHYETTGETITLTPSILIEGDCHFYITNQPFEWNHLE